MFGLIRWRDVVPFIVVTLVAAAGVAAVVPSHTRPLVLLVAVVQILLIVVVVSLIWRQTLRVMERVTDVMRRLARGDWEARLVPTQRRDVRSYVDAFNEMADEFQRRLSVAERQRNELAAVLEHVTDGVLITDEEGRVQVMSQAAARLLGVNATESVGQSFAQVVRDHNLIESERVCRHQGIDTTIGIDLSHLGVSLRASLAPLHIEGEATCLVILQNVTQLRHLETVRRDFVSNISHELRTPLASLRALVDTLRDGALDDPPAAQRFLDRVEGEVDAMTQIVQELLELSRTESGRVPLHLLPAPVADIVLPPLERLQPQAERAHVTLTVNLPADVPSVLADSERLRQVVTNLVHNAIKFTPAGGEITVSAHASGDEVVVSVRDTGMGIPADDLPRIFERFYKADRARSSGGTGLGLALARHVVQAHGGRIWAESVEGRGSTFYFTLPTAVEGDNTPETG